MKRVNTAMEAIPSDEKYSKKVQRKKKSVKDDETTDASSASSSFAPIQSAEDKRDNQRYEKLDLIDRPVEDEKKKNESSDEFMIASVPISEPKNKPERPVPE